MNRVALREAGYGAAVLLSSAGGLVVEIVAGRLLAPYVGMSLYTWTAIIAVVLAGFSIGHWIGGRLAGPEVDGARGRRRVVLALVLAALSTLAILVLLRTLSNPLLESGFGIIFNIVALTTVLFLLPSLFIGIVSPILTKLAVDGAPGQHGRVIGRMYALSATGSILGTLGAGFLFISWIGSTGTILSVAALYGALALAFGGGLRGAGATAAALLVAGGGITAWTLSKGAARSPCTVESDYYCIRADDFSRQTGRASAVLVIDHLVHSINDRDTPEILYTPYIHLMDEIAKRLFPPSGVPATLVIGGGGYSLPRLWAKEAPDVPIVVAEIDPAVTQVARDHLWFKPSGGLKIIHGDARPVLQAMKPAPRFDLVLADAFHDLSMPAHLATREFSAVVKARLRPGGYYAVNVIEGGKSPLFLLSMVHTLRADFPSVEVWAEADQAGRPVRGTYLILAGNRPLPFAGLRARRGLDRTWRRWPDDDLSRRIVEAKSPILTDDYAPVDRLMSHVLLDTGMGR